MSTRISNEPLDNMLRHWAGERAASSQQLDNLQDRIVMALADEATTSNSTPAEMDDSKQPRNGSSVTYPEFPTTFRSRSVGTKRAPVTAFLVGVTLSALVVFVWFAQSVDFEQSQNSLAGGSQAELPGYAQLNDEQLRRRTVLLSEMKELFGEQLTWLAETDSRIEVGLSDRQNVSVPSVLENDEVPLAVRVVVERRAAAGSDWEIAWAVDVVSKSEEVVDLAPATDDGTSMRLWAYAMPDGMFAVDSELSFSSADGGSLVTLPGRAEAFHATFSNVQEDRQPSEEFWTSAGGVEYRVLQTVAVLNKKVG